VCVYRKRFFLPHAKAEVRKRDEEKEEVENRTSYFFKFQQNKEIIK